MESKVIKLPDDIINKIRTFQEKMVTLMAKLGDIQVQRHNLDLLQSELISEYDTNKLEETELIKEVNTKYGVGRLDMKTGELTVFEQ